MPPAGSRPSGHSMIAALVTSGQGKQTPRANHPYSMRHTVQFVWRATNYTNTQRNEMRSCSGKLSHGAAHTKSLLKQHVACLLQHCACMHSLYRNIARQRKQLLLDCWLWCIPRARCQLVVSCNS